MSYRPPNPQPPKHEHFSSSAPLEHSGFVQWGPFTVRVSNYLERYLVEKNSLNNFRIGRTIRFLRC